MKILKKLRKIWNLTKKTCFWVKKFGKVWKVWKKFGKYGKSSEISKKVQKISEKVQKISEKVWKFRKFGIWNFQTFQKLWKNDVQLKIRKSRKTRSDSKTDSKVWLKARNAGPYCSSPTNNLQGLISDAEKHTNVNGKKYEGQFN